jgi:hypothetical protein
LPLLSRFAKEAAMSRVAVQTRPPKSQPAPRPSIDDQRDAWLDDVRRWYYGGMEPLGDVDPAASQPGGDGDGNQPTARS